MTDMACERCGGRVEWQGPLSELGQHGTRCTGCGERNCQRVEPPIREWECDTCAGHGYLSRAACCGRADDARGCWCGSPIEERDPCPAGCDNGVMRMGSHV